MPVNILMPALSPTMEKGNLARWLKKEGDKVKAGDVIAEIETDKATMEYESIDDGVLAKIVVPEGTQDVPVNQLIAVLAAEGEDPKAAAAAAGKSAAAKDKAPGPAKPAAAPATAAPAQPATVAQGVGFSAGRPRRQPRLCVAAGAAARQGLRNRRRAHPGLGAARPDHCARRRGCEIGQGPRGRRHAARHPGAVR